MHGDADVALDDNVSTGQLPREEVVRGLLVDAYERYRTVDEGVVADYIPALARVPPDLFGACIVSARGQTVAIGDATTGSPSRACPSRSCSRSCATRSVTTRRAGSWG